MCKSPRHRLCEGFGVRVGPAVAVGVFVAVAVNVVVAVSVAVGTHVAVGVRVGDAAAVTGAVGTAATGVMAGAGPHAASSKRLMQITRSLVNSAVFMLPSLPIGAATRPDGLWRILSGRQTGWVAIFWLSPRCPPAAG